MSTFLDALTVCFTGMNAKYLREESTMDEMTRMCLSPRTVDRDDIVNEGNELYLEFERISTDPSPEIKDPNRKLDVCESARLRKQPSPRRPHEYISNRNNSYPFKVSVSSSSSSRARSELGIRSSFIPNINMEKARNRIRKGKVKNLRYPPESFWNFDEKCALPDSRNNAHIASQNPSLRRGRESKGRFHCNFSENWLSKGFSTASPTTHSDLYQQERCQERTVRKDRLPQQLIGHNTQHRKKGGIFRRSETDAATIATMDLDLEISSDFLNSASTQPLFMKDHLQLQEWKLDAEKHHHSSKETSEKILASLLGLTPSSHTKNKVAHSKFQALYQSLARNPKNSFEPSEVLPQLQQSSDSSTSRSSPRATPVNSHWNCHTVI
uniref:Uncharacterized protein n=1 Tax=Corethron hystrix TaxID=216773 RepID=A0A7S1FUZ2_9STRA|mmetsp:Transcript_30590/g.70014  ORF Transcript_30590/g.70014 Transcript_30590/m.70014 type:complete len:382 (+) Transcript_30590:286-1431(+)